MPRVKEVHLDGSTLEGGGQLLRLALSLSCLTGKPIHITDIRGNRPRSKASKGRGGGLKKSHTECVKFLAAACNASTSGMVEGSDELRFWPEAKKATEQSADGLRTLNIEQKTPGSMYLILQALLPYLLFGTFSTTDGEQKPIILRITGGTNVSASPSHEYATKVLFPILAEHLGILPIKTTLVKRGWSAMTGAELGEIVFEITPLSKPLPAFTIAERGPLKRVEVCVLANPLEIGEQIATNVCEHFTTSSESETTVSTEISLAENSGRKNRIYILVIAAFEAKNGNTHRIGRDILFDGKKGTNSEALVPMITKKLVEQVEREIKNGGAVDEYMQDQLVVFQALAEGESVVERKQPSLHARTARWVAEMMLKGTKLHFDGDPETSIGACTGVAYNPGRKRQGGVEEQKPPDVGDIAGKLEAVSLSG